RRRAFKDLSGDPSVLAYTIYGHPNARLIFGDQTDLAKIPDFEPPPMTLPDPLRFGDIPSSASRSRRKPWSPPQSRKRWALPAAMIILAFLLAAALGRLSNLLGWNMPPDQITRHDAMATPAGTSVPAKSPQGNRDRGSDQVAAPPAANSARSKPGVSRNSTIDFGGGSTFEIAAPPDVPKDTLSAALRAGAVPLPGMGIEGWTLHLDVDAPRITPHVQDGLPWEACRLVTRGHARRQEGSIDLGTI